MDIIYRGIQIFVYFVGLLFHENCVKVIKFNHKNCLSFSKYKNLILKIGNWPIAKHESQMCDNMYLNEVTVLLE